MESDPIGLGGGVNTYAYARENPIMRSDSSGLFSLIAGAQFSDVDDIPGNTLLGRLPFFGGNLIGLTRGYVAPASCQCKGCGSSWTLGGCSAYLDIRVLIQSGLPSSEDALSRHSESEHVADLKGGVSSIHAAGAAAERAQKQLTFSSQSECELQSSSVVTSAVRAAVRAVSISSSWRDTSGSHT